MPLFPAMGLLMQGLHVFQPKTRTVIDLDSLMSDDHLLRQVDRIVEPAFIRKLTAVLPVTTFWSFLREFSPLGVRGGKTWYHLKSGAIPINTRAAQKSLDQHTGC